MDNDLPMTRLAEMFNVNHFIVSQVNPHVVPFLLKEEDSITQEVQQSNSIATSGPSWLQSATYLAKDEALHRMRTLAEIGVFPNALSKAVSVLSQKYSGDITIFPEISYADFPRMLSNPSPEFVNNAMLCGERATWPKLSRIRNHCAIELALDDAVQKLRARVAFSPSQVDLRVGLPMRSRSDGGKEAKGRRRQRPLSQNSAPATAPPNKPFQHKQENGKAHQKSRSTTTHTSPPFFTGDFSATQVPNDFDRMTSSDAEETSNLPSSTASSSSTLSITSPFDSPPSSPTQATQSRPFSFSQPTTPTGHNHTWGFALTSTTGPPSRSGSKASTTLPTTSLAMTPKSSRQSLTATRPGRSPRPPSFASSHSTE